jgi:flagellin
MEIQKSSSVDRSRNPATAGIARTNKALQKVLERLSTAQRINRASDDAAGLAISEQLRSRIRGFEMAEQNVTDAISALNIGEGAASEITDLLQRNRELAIQASNGTLTDNVRAQIDVEYQQNLQEIDRIAESSQFNNQNLVNGTDMGAGTSEIQTGPEAGDAVGLPVINLGVNPLGLTGTGVATAAGATASITAIDNALDTVNTSRSTIGSTVNRLESTLRNISVAGINTQSAEELLRDQDMAEGIVELTRERLLQESGIYAFSRFNQISANHILSLMQ